MKKSFAYPYGVWLAVFILAPILMVVVYAFLNADGGFTLHNFSYLPGYLPIFGRSFWLAFLSTVVCLALGYPMAYLMSRLSASKQSLCMMLIMLPMWINFLLRTYAWISRRTTACERHDSARDDARHNLGQDDLCERLMWCRARLHRRFYPAGAAWA